MLLAVVAVRVAEVALLATPILIALFVLCRHSTGHSAVSAHGLVLTGLIVTSGLLIAPRGATPLRPSPLSSPAA